MAHGVWREEEMEKRREGALAVHIVHRARTHVARLSSVLSPSSSFRPSSDSSLLALVSHSPLAMPKRKRTADAADAAPKQEQNDVLPQARRLIFSRAPP